MVVRKLMMILYRCLWLAFATLIVAELFGMIFLGQWIFAPAALAILIAITIGRFNAAVAKSRRTPVEIEPPISGRWTALNSPATRIPSHGVHAYAQTHAIDVVAESETLPRPRFTNLWPLVRRNALYPAFGAPLTAVADATVVRATDVQRDHLTRTSYPALMYMLLVEASVRDIFGGSRVVGNHVILDLGNGIFALYGHVQQGSLMVNEGDKVQAGQPLARCGNSGNSTEAHLHFQLMDGPDLDVARGIPFTWRGIGIPANNETFTAHHDDPNLSKQPENAKENL
ncbi:MAG: M23 family metallopeptidase [Corynebacteriales bacterium]|nr:M23 family metallopeptidase [Mycobacteriales bacterium]